MINLTRIDTFNGVIFSIRLGQVNICSPARQCGGDKTDTAGCVVEDGMSHSFVGVERSLQLSTDGLLTLTYRGERDKQLGGFMLYVLHYKSMGTISGPTGALYADTIHLTLTHASKYKSV